MPLEHARRRPIPRPLLINGTIGMVVLTLMWVCSRIPDEPTGSPLIFCLAREGGQSQNWDDLEPWPREGCSAAWGVVDHQKIAIRWGGRLYKDVVPPVERFENFRGGVDLTSFDYGSTYGGKWSWAASGHNIFWGAPPGGWARVFELRCADPASLPCQGVLRGIEGTGRQGANYRFELRAGS